MSNWRLEAKNLFLTYPQCETTKEDCMTEIKAYFGTNIVFAIVAVEDHKDGTPHLHAAISLHQRFRTRKPAALDVLAGQHGNYQGARNMSATVKYVVKDKEYVSEGIDVELYLKQSKKKKTTKISLVSSAVNEGQDIHEIDSKFPGFVMMHKRKVEDYIQMKRSYNLKRQKIGKDSLIKKIKEDLETKELSEEDIDIGEWLLDVFNREDELPFSTPQLFLFGETQLGKTTLLRNITKYISVYTMPTEDFYDNWYDNQYDCVFFDEFSGCKTITFLNQFLDGQTMTLRKKGSQSIKNTNLPVLMVSNISLEEIYINSTRIKLDALRRRMKFVELFTPINILT